MIAVGCREPVGRTRVKAHRTQDEEANPCAYNHRLYYPGGCWVRFLKAVADK